MRLAIGLRLDYHVDLFCAIPSWLRNVRVDGHRLHILTALITHRTRQFLGFLEGLLGARRATYLTSIHVQVPVRALVSARSHGV